MKKAFIIHFRNGTQLKIQEDAMLTLKVKDDVASFTEAGDGVIMAVNMREVFYIRTESAPISISKEPVPGQDDA